MDKKTIMLGMVFGSAIGGWLPTLFGVGFFSFTSIIFSGIGGILGIWLTYRFLK